MAYGVAGAADDDDDDADDDELLADVEVRADTPATRPAAGIGVVALGTTNVSGLATIAAILAWTAQP